MNAPVIEGLSHYRSCTCKSLHGAKRCRVLFIPAQLWCLAPAGWCGALALLSPGLAEPFRPCLGPELFGVHRDHLPSPNSSVLQALTPRRVFSHFKCD